MANDLITYSSELMSNFKQAEVAAAEAKFEALQTDDGRSLLFSVGTDGVLYVTEESVGHVTGWEKSDLSSTLASDYGGGPITTRTFAVAQNRGNPSIDMAVVVTASQNDNLYLSLSNSTSDTGWVKEPKWVRFPFDDPAHPLSRVMVVNVFISQASDGEYIVVDVLRDPADSVPVVFRYYIDPTKKATGQAWNPHDVAADLDASKFVSCLGRRKGDRVDGLYTLGSIGDHTSLIYQPLYNPFNPHIPANPARLILPDTSAPSAIASVAVDGQATDLYVACKQSLYYFPCNAQADGATGTKVLDNPLFEDVARLFAFATADKVIVWGLNRADQVFYTTCDRTQIHNSAAWSYPLPILENVEQLSPYVNRADDGQTFFAHTGVNQLQKAVQTPATTTWKFDSILLPTLPTAKATKFSSYTTRLQVTDANKKPLAGAKINLSSAHRSNVYINNRYYVLDATPIPVTADETGGLVIVEWVTNLQATCLRVHGDDGSVLSINPMDKPFQKVAQLNSEDKLASAVVPNQNGTTRPLISPSTGEQDRQNIVDAIGSLASAYRMLPADGSVKAQADGGVSAGRTLLSVPPANVASLGVGAPAAQDVLESRTDFGESIEVLAGDLFKFLDSAADYVIHIVKEVDEDVWYFVAEIAGKMYRFVLDATVQVLGALVYIFDAIKTAIEDLIDYLKFLFEWGDFVRTKDVYKKILLLYFDHLLDEIEDLKTNFNGLITEAKDTVDDWAGVKHDDWKPGVENSNQPPGYVRAITDFEEVFTAPAMFLFHHFLDNVPNSQGTSNAAVDVIDDLLNRTIQALEDEGNVLIDAVDRIRSELVENSQYESLSLEDVLKKLTAIVVDALLNSTEDLVDLLIDVFVMLARETVEALDTPIWIPVVSDILEDAFGVRISFSILDVIVMVGAIPATLVYKVINKSAPFSSSDGFSEKILAAKDVYALRAAFDGSGGTPRLAAAGLSSALGADGAGKQASPFLPIDLPPDAQRVIFIVGHTLGGVVSMVTAVLAVADALSEEGNSEYETAVGVSAAVGAIAAGQAAILAQPYPIQNAVMSKLSTAATGATLLGKVAFYVAPKAIAKKRGITDQGEIQSLTTKTKKIGSGFDAVIAVIALVPTCYHYFELSKDPASTDRTEAFIDETSNICNYLNRICAFAVRMDEDPESKAILAGVMGVLIFLYGGLQIAESITEAVGGE